MKAEFERAEAQAVAAAERAKRASDERLAELTRMEAELAAAGNRAVQAAEARVAALEAEFARLEADATAAVEHARREGDERMRQLRPSSTASRGRQRPSSGSVVKARSSSTKSRPSSSVSRATPRRPSSGPGAKPTSGCTRSRPSSSVPRATPRRPSSASGAKFDERLHQAVAEIERLSERAQRAESWLRLIEKTIEDKLIAPLAAARATLPPR